MAGPTGPQPEGAPDMGRAIRAGLKACAALAVVGAVMAPASAAAQQSINFSFGGFTPRSEDARDQNDVLVQDRTFLDFNVGDLTGPTVSGEWLIGLGNNFDAGLGLGFYQHTTTAADRFSEFDVTGDPILADLKLRVVPFNATFRWLPLGRSRGVVPYVGAGVGGVGGGHREGGAFVGRGEVTIIHGNFVGSGSAVGPVILGGLPVPGGAGRFRGELKRQAAERDRA